VIGVTEITRTPDVATYTADAVALLVYLVDSLPDGADLVFVEAEAGESVIRAPSTALAEVIYAVSRDKEVRSVQLVGSPDETRQALLANGPVSSAPEHRERGQGPVVAVHGSPGRHRLQKLSGGVVAGGLLRPRAGGYNGGRRAASVSAGSPSAGGFTPRRRRP
jgi:hypothetical protein